MTAWIETETRALLKRCPPQKYAPADTSAYSLVLNVVQEERWPRIAAAFYRACGLSEDKAREILANPLPAVLQSGLCYEDAAIGQYELFACDAICLIIPDRVLASPPPGYLSELYASILDSREFELVPVTIEYLPPDERTRDLLERFLDCSECMLPATVQMVRKKGWILAQLAAKIGGRVSVPE
jgi:hypothetical protein